MKQSDNNDDTYEAMIHMKQSDSMLAIYKLLLMLLVIAKSQNPVDIQFWIENYLNAHSKMLKILQ
jgi:hypothetical protein